MSECPSDLVPRDPIAMVTGRYPGLSLTFNEREVRALRAMDCEVVAAMLRQSSVLVVPSFSEGLPVGIMEAMASRLPVVASAVDGIPELVRDGETGLLVPPDDPEPLAEAGRHLVAAPYDARRNADLLLQTLRRSGPSSQQLH
jgi:glycosyltransferase involved in cell wall biosynthesis